MSTNFKTIIADLNAKLAATEERRAQLVTERIETSFDAHTGGNTEARRRLSAINKSIAEIVSEAESLQEALASARRREKAAEHAVHVEKAKADARAALERITDWRERAARLDKALADFGEAYGKLNADMLVLAMLGAPPSGAMVRSACPRAVAAALQAIGITREIEGLGFLAPHERHSLADVVSGWVLQVERWAQARLGDDKAKEAA
jgi:hypothetical protein